ncbi:helix-turn-helix domain-containing protein [Sphingobium phenoxybenzoativorans]|uniref:Helix-turn-helix domain-containing protein n=1 Tax=Sphingobium phenoxybenzoativorans TaxID=1592790 RepID=A0A975K5E4_9SPHN|nr:helix-turn-helix domain-containing protein [Sphingobium phenoxybenzoativorans]QUT05131.1 helix-turn-helix domain-containing protein [Sphingobium phenoxybenzoativorans]
MDDTARRAQAAREGSPFLTAKQTAYHLGIAYTTLKDLRTRGAGPKCRKHGRTWRYHIDDIEAWSAGRSIGGDQGGSNQSSGISAGIKRSGGRHG